MPKYRCSKFQKFAIKWLLFFTIACFINSILVIGVELYTGDQYLAPLMNGRYSLAGILPFAHCLFVFVCLVIYSAIQGTRGKETGIWDKYIEENYPDIWKRFHPWGPRSFSNFYGIPFLMGKYDSGLDERLNRIKFDLKVNSILLLWMTFLIPVVWIFNFILIDALDKFPP
jgi:hypothetical protein